MIDENTKSSLLKQIALSGAIDNAIETPVINGNLNHILHRASGLPRIRIPERFKLLLSLPQTLQGVSPFEIRCALCNRVISYPAWYHSVKYSINVFHYFVCFDATSPLKPTIACYRRK